MNNVRQKLGRLAPMLQTIRGVWYRLAADAAPLEAPAEVGAAER
jgi:hypothetical protein